MTEASEVSAISPCPGGLLPAAGAECLRACADAGHAFSWCSRRPRPPGTLAEAPPRQQSQCHDQKKTEQAEKRCPIRIKNREDDNLPGLECVCVCAHSDITK